MLHRYNFPGKVNQFSSQEINKQPANNEFYNEQACVNAPIYTSATHENALFQQEGFFLAI
jgi:hypothetical protein